MSTDIKPELSTKNPYYISKHRYYELKNFCLQYYEWVEAKKQLIANIQKSSSIVKPSSETQSMVEKMGMKLFEMDNRIKLVEQTAMVAASNEEGLSYILFKAVTEGLSYDKLNAKDTIYCGRDYYYQTYRKFFWLLDKRR